MFSQTATYRIQSKEPAFVIVALIAHYETKYVRFSFASVSNVDVDVDVDVDVPRLRLLPNSVRWKGIRNTHV